MNRASDVYTAQVRQELAAMAALKMRGARGALNRIDAMQETIKEAEDGGMSVRDAADLLIDLS